MKKYLAVARIGWLEGLEYRTEFFMSILSWGIRLLISLFLWFAIVQAKGGPIGTYSFQEILVYFFLIQIISSLHFTFIGFEISKDIHRGDIANFLLKPFHYILFRLSHSLSYQFLRLLISVIIFAPIIILITGKLAFAPWKIPIFFISMLGAYLINASFQIIIGLSSFWVVNATRFLFTYFAILTMASGIIFPLDLFPPQLYTIATYLPFAHIFYFPVKMMQSATFEPLFYQALAIQWIYVVALLTVVTGFYRLGLRKVESVGR